MQNRLFVIELAASGEPCLRSWVQHRWPSPFIAGGCCSNDHSCLQTERISMGNSLTLSIGNEILRTELHAMICLIKPGVRSVCLAAFSKFILTISRNLGSSSGALVGSDTPTVTQFFSDKKRFVFATPSRGGRPTLPWQLLPGNAKSVLFNHQPLLGQDPKCDRLWICNENGNWQFFEDKSKGRWHIPGGEASHGESPQNVTEWKIKRPHFVAVPVALLRLRSPTHRRRGQTRLKVRLHLRFDQQVFSSPHRVQIAYFRSGQCFGESRVTMVPLHRAPVMARTVTKKKWNKQTNKLQKKWRIQPFDSVRRFQATLLLRTTCVRLWGNWFASYVAALQTKNQKNHLQERKKESTHIHH